MTTTTHQLPAAARSATVGNHMEQTVADLITKASGAYCSPTSAAWFIASLRANGYVIKRAVPPCRGYEVDCNKT
jgi:hypothetical protein